MIISVLFNLVLKILNFYNRNHMNGNCHRDNILSLRKGFRGTKVMFITKWCFTTSRDVKSNGRVIHAGYVSTFSGVTRTTL